MKRPPSTLPRPARAWMVCAVACGVASVTGCAPRTSTAPAPPSPAAATAVPGVDALGNEIVARTNRERVSLGLEPLARSVALTRAAKLQASQMADRAKLAHELPGAAYPTLDNRLAAVGYFMRASGENVAEGYPSPAAVVAGWMTSPGHRANIVSTNFTEMGAAVATAKNGRRFYAQVFGAPQ